MKQTLSPSARRRKAALPLAVVALLLMLIGLVAVVLWASGLVRGFVENSTEREEYEDFIRPVVMMDPIPFDDIAKADGAFVREAALWSALSDPKRDTYSYDDLGLLLLPATDVNVAATRLFGPEAAVEHVSFEDIDGTYLYDPEIAAYRIPAISKNAYSPSVTEIRREGDTILLTVGYVAPGNLWSTHTRNRSGEPDPEKYMLYRLTKTKSGYYIDAVLDVGAA